MDWSLKYKSYLTNLKGLVSDAALAREGSLEWTADNFDAASGPYVMPLIVSSTSAFTTRMPSLKLALQQCQAIGMNFTRLAENSRLLVTHQSFMAMADRVWVLFTTHGMTPVILQLVSHLFQVFVTFIVVRTNGNSAINIASYTKYAALKSKGCTNSDVLTKTNNVEDFLDGKAAMIVDGTWDTKKFTDQFGDKVAAFVPPFSDNPIKGVVEFAGQGFGLTNYSKNSAAAAAFLEYMTTDAAAMVVDAAGLIPNVNGSTTSMQ